MNCVPQRVKGNVGAKYYSKEHHPVVGDVQALVVAGIVFAYR
jgi:hypothetical protein